MTVREGPGSLRVPLAASLLLHAALLGLLALGLPRLLPEPAGSVEIRLVSLESEEGVGGGEGGGITAGAPTGAGRPLARAPAVVGRTAGPLPAPPPAPSAEARAASGGPMAVEGPKGAAPDPPLGTPSGFEVPQGPPVTEGALPGQGPAAARSATAGPGGAVGAPDGGRGAEQEGGGAGWTGGPLARGREGFRGTGDGTDGPGGVGTSGLGSGTGRDGAFAYILRRIEAAKHYPEDARRLGHRGTVAVRFRIGPDGAVASAEVAASSGSSLLDVASLETVRRAAPLPAVPGWLRVRISYGLAEARP